MVNATAGPSGDDPVPPAKRKFGSADQRRGSLSRFVATTLSFTFGDFNVLKSVLFGDREHARAPKELPRRMELAGHDL